MLRPLPRAGERKDVKESFYSQEDLSKVFGEGKGWKGNFLYKGHSYCGRLSCWLQPCD